MTGVSRSVIRDLLEVLALALALYIVASIAVGTVHVVGSSMNPSLQNDDLVIASRIDYRLHAPERGDIVIVKDPFDPSQDFIKRVVGLPGDHVLIRAGHVYLNGARLDEPYIAPDWRTTTNWPALPDQPDGEVVPPGNYFLLGDNRDHSSDSRLFGYVPQGQIEGKAIARFWPPGGLELLSLRPSFAKKP
jgi:signal peptidase I